MYPQPLLLFWNVTMGRDMITCHIAPLAWVNQTNLVLIVLKKIHLYCNILFFFKINFLLMEVPNTKYLFNGENPLPKLILPQLPQITLILPKLTIVSNKNPPWCFLWVSYGPNGITESFVYSFICNFFLCCFLFHGAFQTNQKYSLSKRLLPSLYPPHVKPLLHARLAALFLLLIVSTSNHYLDR